MHNIKEESSRFGKRLMDRHAELDSAYRNRMRIRNKSGVTWNKIKLRYHHKTKTQGFRPCVTV